MFHKIKYNFLILLLINITLWKIGLAIDLYIPEDEQFKLSYINELVNNYSIKYHDINIYFTEDYFVPSQYDIPYFGVPPNTNVTIIGNPNNENGTAFDFLNNFNHFSIVFSEYTGQQFKFENISFINYIDEYKTGHSLFHTRSYDKEFSIVFKNCNFDIGSSLILILEIQMTIKNNLNDYQILFDSCRFK